MIRKQLKNCSVLSPGGVIQAFPEPESERGKMLLLMVKNIDSCRDHTMFKNESNISVHELSSGSKKSIKSKFKSQVEGCNISYH